MSYESDFLPMILEFMRESPCTAIHHKYSQGAYDPATSEYTTVQVDTPCQVLVQDLTRNSNGLSSIYGTEILAGDKDMYLLPPNKIDATQPPLVIDTTSDRITVGGITYKIVNMKAADQTGNNPILYQLMLRR